MNQSALAGYNPKESTPLDSTCSVEQATPTAKPTGEEIVRAVSQNDSRTVITTSGEHALHVPPHAYVQPGDVLNVVRDRTGVLVAVNKLVWDKYDNAPDQVKLFPPYSVTREIHVPPHNICVTFMERTNPKDWQAAKLLEKFHYRGMGLSKIVGRRSVLLAKIEGAGIVGYGVVSASVLAAKPRFQILRTNVGELLKTKFINKLVRIPRIVIHPEFRGIGLGALLAIQLVDFVKERWDVKGYRPELVEVIAAMTEYHRFFQAAGFLEGGYTEGYKGLAITPRYGSGSFAARRNTDKYKFMIDQGPKPYLVFPLTRKMEERVNAALPKQPAKKTLARPVPLLERPILFWRASITYKAWNGLSSRARLIRDGFGVDSSQMYSPILRNLDLRIEPGDMVLLTGASGSGKSTLIKVLAEPRSALRELMHIEGRCPTIRKRLAVLGAAPNSRRPLVDQIGTELHEAIKTLNAVGLAEAHLYLKRPTQISEGQKYRFAVALLCDSGKPLWLADEFASTLDPLNAAIVAKGLRKVAYQKGATCVIAAPHSANFAESLLPNMAVHLSWGGVASINGMRARARREQNNWVFRVRNCGQADLTDLCFGGQDRLGRFYKRTTLQSLPPFGRARFELPVEELDSYQSIKITAKEGVGEIFYAT